MKFVKIFFFFLGSTALILIVLSLRNTYFLHIVYVDTENNCNIDIPPSLHYNSRDIKTAIEVIKTNSPEYYKKLCSYVATISKTNECDYNSTACAYGENKIGINKLNDISIPEIAAIIVHEACHFHQGHTATPESYINYIPGSREPECYQAQNEFLGNLKRQTNNL